MAARHEEDCNKKKYFLMFLACKGLSNDDVGVARSIIFQEIRPGAGFKTGDFVEERLQELSLNDTDVHYDSDPSVPLPLFAPSVSLAKGNLDPSFTPRCGATAVVRGGAIAACCSWRH